MDDDGLEVRGFNGGYSLWFCTMGSIGLAAFVFLAMI